MPRPGAPAALCILPIGPPLVCALPYGETAPFLVYRPRDSSGGHGMSKRAFLSGLAAVAILHAGTAGAQDADVATQVVDAMNKLFGVHPGFRAFHAKGVVVEGTFRGSPEARALSKASLFAGTAIPVTVRFSDNTGLPTIPDGSPDANPHGMALKFHLPDGSETDMVTNSLKVFPVSTAADLRDLFEAVAASPPTAPKPTKLEQFV